jgi:nicotinamidase-related amidase
MNNTDTTHRKGIIGNPNSTNFWLYDSNDGFDLTHSPSPTSGASTTPRIKFQTTTLPITISPTKSALVIVDMQNFFLSPCLGRPSDSKGLQAQQQLLSHAIPAARKAGIRIIWLNWGLTETEISNMPPATLRAFGFETVPAEQFASSASWAEIEAKQKQAAIDSHGVNEGCHDFPTTPSQTETPSGKNPRLYRGLGTDIGPVTLADGTTVVPGGRLLMRDTWNADLTPELRASYEEEGLQPTNPVPDMWIHKNRMSGLWGPSTDCTEFLEGHGIQTLLFAGVNTDQCVGGSLQDVSSALPPYTHISLSLFSFLRTEFPANALSSFLFLPRHFQKATIRSCWRTGAARPARPAAKKASSSILRRPGGSRRPVARLRMVLMNRSSSVR